MNRKYRNLSLSSGRPRAASVCFQYLEGGVLGGVLPVLRDQRLELRQLLVQARPGTALNPQKRFLVTIDGYSTGDFFWGDEGFA